MATVSLTDEMVRRPKHGKRLTTRSGAFEERGQTLGLADYWQVDCVSLVYGSDALNSLKWPDPPAWQL